MPAVSDKIEHQIRDFPARRYAAGQMILFAHEDPEYVFYNSTGRVRMYDVSAKGNEVVVNVYEPGRFFPLGWALNNTPNHFFLKAETDVLLYLIPPDRAIDIITSDREITVDLLKRIYQKTERLLEQMTFLMAATAERRVMYALSLECRRFGRQLADKSYLAPVREIDLAGRSGLSRETVSREFHKLKQRGWVRLEKDGIRVYDLDELEAQIGAIQ